MQIDETTGPGQTPDMPGRIRQGLSSVDIRAQASWDQVVPNLSPTSVPSSVRTPVSGATNSVTPAGEVGSKHSFDGANALISGPPSATSGPVSVPGRVVLLSGKLLSSEPIFSQAHTSITSPALDSIPNLSSWSSCMRSSENTPVFETPAPQTVFLKVKNLSSQPIFSQAPPSRSALPIPNPHLSSGTHLERNVDATPFSATPSLQTMSTHDQAFSSESILSQAPSSSALPALNSDPRPSSAVPLQRHVSAHLDCGAPVSQTVSLCVKNLSSQPIFSQAHISTTSPMPKSTSCMSPATPLVHDGNDSLTREAPEVPKSQSLNIKTLSTQSSFPQAQTGSASPSPNSNPRLSSADSPQHHIIDAPASRSRLEPRILSLSVNRLSTQPTFSQAQTSTASPTPDANPRPSSAVSMHDIWGTPASGPPQELKTVSLNVRNLSSQPIFSQAQTSTASPTPDYNARPSSAVSPQQHANDTFNLASGPPEKTMTASLDVKSLISQPMLHQAQTSAAPPMPNPPASLKASLKPDVEDIPPSVTLHVNNLSSEPIFSRSVSTGQGDVQLNITEADTDDNLQVCHVT